MKLINSSTMREIDRRAIEDYHIPGLVLMENAGLEVVNAIEKEFGASTGRALILCGSGNNGGDGLVVARHLKVRGWSVRVFLAAPPERYSGDSAINLKSAENYGVRIDVCSSEDLTPLIACIQGADIVVDALLGTGAHGAPHGIIASMISELSQCMRPIVSIDLPSGVEIDTGAVPGEAVRASFTITFGLPRPGMFLYPGSEHIGRLYIGEICLPPDLLRDAAGIELLSLNTINRLLPVRPKNSHKGNFGRVLIVAGSKGMIGAAALAAKGALKSGAGLATVACPETLVDSITATVPEATTMPLNCDDGVLNPDAAEEILKHSDNFDCLVIGPGLSRTPSALSAISIILNKSKLPAVVDADALNVIKEISRPEDVPMVITPHAGELGRILDIDREQVEAARLQSAGKAATLLNCVAVLKGSNTIISSPDGQTAINPTGNSGLAKGGSGDVLSGIIGTFMAQRLNPFIACCSGCFVHGAAADLIAEEHGTYGVMASEVAEYVPDAIWRIQNGGRRKKQD